MESVLYGNPLTNDILVTLPKFHGKEIGKRERAQHALDTMNDKKKYQAIEFVKDLKKKYGSGESTHCIFYNATGDAITFEGNHDWRGHSYKYPYPPEVGNGQWGVFLHVHHTAFPTGTIGAVVYSGKNENGKDTDWMQAWYNPWVGTNRAYTEVNETGYFTGRVWHRIYDKLDNASANNKYESNGGQSSVGIGDDTSPFFEGVMTLEGLKIQQSK